MSKRRKPAVHASPENTKEQYSWDFLHDASEARRLIHRAFGDLIGKGYSIREVSHYLIGEVFDAEMNELAGWGAEPLKDLTKEDSYAEKLGTGSDGGRSVEP